MAMARQPVFATVWTGSDPEYFPYLWKPQSTVYLSFQCQGRSIHSIFWILRWVVFDIVNFSMDKTAVFANNSLCSLSSVSETVFELDVTLLDSTTLAEWIKCHTMWHCNQRTLKPNISWLTMIWTFIFRVWKCRHKLRCPCTEGKSLQFHFCYAEDKSERKCSSQPLYLNVAVGRHKPQTHSYVFFNRLIIGLWEQFVGSHIYTLISEYLWVQCSFFLLHKLKKLLTAHWKNKILKTVVIRSQQHL